MKTIAIHQPNFLPWFGYFEKIKRADQFVFLDHVPFSKGSYTNRVQYFCKSSKTVKWLTIPVKYAPLGTAISEIKLPESGNWEAKLILTIQQNIDSPLTELICDTIKNRRTNNLADLNVVLVRQVLNFLCIKSNILRSSTLSLDKFEGQEVLKICSLLEADKYVGGIGSRNYLDEEAFAQNDIQVELLDFKEVLVEEKGLDKELVGLTGMYLL